MKNKILTFLCIIIFHQFYFSQREMPTEYILDEGYINKDQYADFVKVIKETHKHHEEIDCDIITVSISSKLEDNELKFLYFSNSHIIGCDGIPDDKLKYRIKIKKGKVIVTKEYLYFPRNDKLKKTIIFSYDEQLNNLYLEKTIEIFTVNISGEKYKKVRIAGDFCKVSFDEYYNQ